MNPVRTQLVKMGLGDGIRIVDGIASDGTEFEIELTAGVFAEFDVAVSSFDFFAADFLVGLPVHIRRGALSGRVRLYHQSSHLGDDILGRDDIVLEEQGGYDFEAVEVSAGWLYSGFYPYLGAEYRFRRTPEPQDASVFHLGVVATRPSSISRTVGLIGGVHATFSENGAGTTGFSGRAGLEWLRKGRDGVNRPLRILVEGRHGNAGAGRFFRLERTSFGVVLEIGR